jgi:DNA-binding MarR family transcriptional regulator
VFAVLTRHGQEVLRRAAPTHVRGIRDNLVDLLSAEEQLMLAEVFERVITHLRRQ